MVITRDQLGICVCNIRTPLSSGKETTGTGTFIVKDSKIYILTASHVVNNINLKSYVVCSDSSGSPINILLTNLIGTNTFIHHPQADLAKVQLMYNPNNILEKRCFPFEQINITNDLISKDVELTSIGFPLGLGSGGAKFSPLTYRTYVASPAISMTRADKKIISDFIILELPSIGGYSGGPTFDLGYMIVGAMQTVKDKTILHGVIHGTISDETGGKLAAVTPCKYLDKWF